MTHQVATTPTLEGTPVEVEGDTSNQFAVYTRGVKSSGSCTSIAPLNKLAVTIDDKEFPMEIDMSSAVTLLNSTDFSKLGGHLSLLKAPFVILTSYTRDIIQCLGKKHIEVKRGRPGR